MDFSKKINIPLTLAKVVISGVILLEIIAPLIIVSYTYTGLFSLLPLFKAALLALIVFTIVATSMYHNPFTSRKNHIQFITHVSLIGGLLALYMR